MFLGVLVTFWAFLGPFRGRLGCVLHVLGRGSGHIGASDRRLVAFGGRVEGVLEASGCVLGHLGVFLGAS